MHERPFRFHRTQSTLIVIAYLLFFFWCCPTVPALATKLRLAYSLSEATWGALCIFGWLSVVVAMAAALRGLSGRSRSAFAVLMFVVLPLWGLVLNADCSECQVYSPAIAYRPFASPEVYGLLILHWATAGGYAISQRQSELLPPRVEAWVATLLLCGLLQNVALAIQLVDMIPWLILFPMTLPIITPFVLVILFWRELSRRLRASAERARTPVLLGPVILRAPLVIGAHALLQGLWRGHPSAALDVIARTCTHPLSTLLLQVQCPTCGHNLW
ncbi:MAG TPA: hypothetical protein VER96_26535 [Polyangiaceae bacterium]|nr:hypothetical protein [Polyangiaceae bacterium]